MLLYKKNKKYRKLIESTVVSFYKNNDQWLGFYSLSPILTRWILNQTNILLNLNR